MARLLAICIEYFIFVGVVFLINLAFGLAWNIWIIAIFIEIANILYTNYKKRQEFIKGP